MVICNHHFIPSEITTSYGKVDPKHKTTRQNNNRNNNTTQTKNKQKSQTKPKNQQQKQPNTTKEGSNKHQHPPHKSLSRSTKYM